uniref:Uncharacterized protein n=1 Tax=Lepeophtheirus salmonis TaxID=72036 RepID=A0A0K2T3U1_LEPSM
MLSVLSNFCSCFMLSVLSNFCSCFSLFLLSAENRKCKVM